MIGPEEIDLEREISLVLSETCNPETVESCDGKTIPELCRTCARSPDRLKNVSPYTSSLLRVHTLQRAGFRFENDSFGLQFWFDLGLLKQRIDEIKQSVPNI